MIFACVLVAMCLMGAQAQEDCDKNFPATVELKGQIIMCDVSRTSPSCSNPEELSYSCTDPTVANEKLIVNAENPELSTDIDDLCRDMLGVIGFDYRPSPDLVSVIGEPSDVYFRYTSEKGWQQLRRGQDIPSGTILATIADIRCLATARK